MHRASKGRKKEKEKKGKGGPFPFMNFPSLSFLYSLFLLHPYLMRASVKLNKGKRGEKGREGSKEELSSLLTNTNET